MGLIRADPTTVVYAGEYIDVRNVGVVREALREAIDRGDPLVLLDASDLRAIDATGLGMLTAAHFRAERSGCDLRVHHPGSAVRRVLAVTGLNRVLHLDRHLSLTG